MYLLSKTFWTRLTLHNVRNLIINYTFRSRKVTIKCTPRRRELNTTFTPRKRKQGINYIPRRRKLRTNYSSWKRNLHMVFHHVDHSQRQRHNFLRKKKRIRRHYSKIVANPPDTCIIYCLSATPCVAITIRHPRQLAPSWALFASVCA